MKLMIASDLHGSAFYCRQLLAAMEREQPDKLLLLGGYSVPRPPQRPAGGLCPQRGNCHAESPAGAAAVRARQLRYRGGPDGAGLPDFGRLCPAVCRFPHSVCHPRPPLQHGLPARRRLPRGIFLLHGHTHVPAWQEFGSGNLYLNPGSVAIPKENSAHSYMMLTDSGFAWKDLEGSIYHTLALDCPNCG